MANLWKLMAEALTRPTQFMRIRNYCRQSSSSSSSPLSYYHFVGKEKFTYRNVGQCLDNSANEYSGSEAIVSFHEKKRYTFHELRREVDRVAAGLLKCGLRRGDAVGILAPNGVQWYLTMLGAARAGLVSVGLNPAFQVPEIEYCLNKAKVRAVVVAESFKSQNYYEMFQNICPKLSSSEQTAPQFGERLPFLKSLIIDGAAKYPGAIPFTQIQDWANDREIENIAKIQESISPESPCNIQFTSGTTGKPKAALLSHFNFVNNGIHVGKRTEIFGKRICVQVPLFHVYGVVIAIMGGINYGATMVLPSASFNAEQSLRAIVAEACNVIYGTPTMYVDLIRKQKELKLPLTTAKIAVTGGAPCSPQLFRDIKDVLGLEQVKTVYGLTESTAVIFQSRPGDTEDQVLNTVGHIQDHIEAKVVDASGQTVPFGQRGELCVRGYLTMLGYLDDETKTNEVLGPDKWLRTGDQFILQEDGYGQIVGRLKEMIIRGGENIFPKEIEDFLNTHPNVIESHVIGVDDERLGEEICAFVRLQDDNRPLLQSDVKEFCRGRLAHFKVPRYVVIVRDFPKTTSGKIKKFELKNSYNQLKRSGEI